MNRVQIAFRSRIKLFYRPEKLKRPVQKLPRGAVYFLGKLLTLGIRTTEVQGWKRQSLTTNCGY
ncbi:fimbria/pilus periplasmic chaperone [Burkholderia glumae]|uniref:fimbria/pilus periplasmic chaperone n=1 Tax=Burkholderia glumae TaxID=337 RepID=UPI000A2F38C9|nr:fimbria/pilus periplasmic chaperone [Burkholderia glumae]